MGSPNWKDAHADFVMIALLLKIQRISSLLTMIVYGSMVTGCEQETGGVGFYP